MKFNKEQLLAIETLDKNVCVIAGAGTGKTAILTERFINIVQKSKREKTKALESILAITFTEKATKEMIGRIKERLYQLEIEDESYRGLTDNLSFLNISTIHGFCTSVLRENSLLLGLDSNFDILEQYESESILTKVIEEELNEYMVKNDSIKKIMLSRLDYNKKNLVEKIKKSFIKIRNKGYDIDLLIEKLPDKDYSEKDIEDFYTRSLNFKDTLYSEKIISGGFGFVTSFKKGLYGKMLEDITSSQMTEILNKYINDLSKIKPKLKGLTDYSIEYEYLYRQAENIILSLEKENYYIYKEFAEIFKEIERRFLKTKLEANSLDFDDLLFFTRELFRDEVIAREYKKKFDYIMIDEFQDTNSLQRDIFFILASDKSLLDRNNLFLVGDPKQSIYGFRGSDIDVFYKSLEEVKNSGGEIISLKENYRSSGELIRYTNNIFDSIMGDRYDKLEHNTDYRPKKVSILNLMGSECSEGDLIASKILELVNMGRSFDEIAILYRSSNKLKDLEISLKKYGIPHINPNSKDYYNRREIKDLILFLKVVNLPEDSHSLFGLLKSRVFLIDDLRLFELNQFDGDNLYEKLQSPNLKDEELIKARKIIDGLIARKDQMDLMDLVNEIIQESNYMQLMAAFGSSGQELENIRKFQKITLEYCSENQGILNEFLDFLEEEKNKDIEEAKVNTKTKGVVLNTIHGSKGLEYPIVFIYNSDSKVKKQSELILVNGKKGFGLNISETKKTYDIVRDEIYLEELEELKRIFYVAVTRAKEELYISNISKDGKLKNDERSILGMLPMADGYDYQVIQGKPLAIKEEKQSISLMALDKGKTSDHIILKKEKPRSSFSAYSIFKNCPRKYYYKYKLGLSDFELDYEKMTEGKIKEDHILSQETSGQIKAVEFGLLVHKMIELANEKNIDFDKTFKLSLAILELEGDDDLEVRAKNYFKNYKSHNIPGKKFSEYEFLLQLDQGIIFGSIDELIINDDGILIKDFKTNRVDNLDCLVSIYRPQIELYSIAAEQIFRGESRSVIHFLETNQIVEIKKDPSYRKNLLEDVNKFLSFIYFNDSIESYNCCDRCDEYCKYKKICMG